MKKILIIDDEKEILDLLKKKLEQNNYAVLIATNGPEALAISGAQKPDLILLDIAIPQMDGYVICEKLKFDTSTKDIPVIFLTGKDFDPKTVLSRCQNLGGAGFFSKMGGLNKLIDEIKAIIG